MVAFTPVDGRPDQAWIEARLGAWNTLHSVVPHGFGAYVRVFHPVEARLLKWSGSAHEVREERLLTWREVAELTGAVAHPLMQWSRIGRKLPRFREGTTAWSYGEPAMGSMPVELMGRLAGLLGRTGATACRAGLWEGHGWLHPGSSSALVSFSGGDDQARDPERLRMVDESLPFDPSEWEGRKLELPNRVYFVFECDLASLMDPAWAEDSGWGWGTSFWGDTPNLLWPLDRSWFLVSEIDFDSTVIGCSSALAAELLADDTLETALVPEGASLGFDADALNG